MDIYRWTDFETGTPWDTGAATGEYAAAATRELLRLATELQHTILHNRAITTDLRRANEEVKRLAQREADLLANIRAMEESAADGRRLADENEHEITALERERDALATRVKELEEELRQAEHREGLWKDAAEKTSARCRGAEETARRLAEKEHQLSLARDQIVALERENRDKCLELAEKAEEIRNLGERVRLGDALVSILSSHCGERGDSEGAEDTLRRMIRERDASREARIRLDAAIEKLARDGRDAEQWRDRLDAQMRSSGAAIKDGIAHVERARGALTSLASHPAVVHALEQLDLAHEVLSAAVRGDRGDAAPVVEAEPVPIAARLEGLETAWAGLAERLTAVMRFIGGHATMLTDHADRLTKIEADLMKLEDGALEAAHFQAQHHERLVALEGKG